MDTIAASEVGQSGAVLRDKVAQEIVGSRIDAVAVKVLTKVVAATLGAGDGGFPAFDAAAQIAAGKISSDYISGQFTRVLFDTDNPDKLGDYYRDESGVWKEDVKTLESVMTDKGSRIEHVTTTEIVKDAQVVEVLEAQWSFKKQTSNSVVLDNGLRYFELNEGGVGQFNLDGSITEYNSNGMFRHQDGESFAIVQTYDGLREIPITGFTTNAFGEKVAELDWKNAEHTSIGLIESGLSPDSYISFQERRIANLKNEIDYIEQKQIDIKNPEFRGIIKINSEYEISQIEQDLKKFYEVRVESNQYFEQALISDFAINELGLSGREASLLKHYLDEDDIFDLIAEANLETIQTTLDDLEQRFQKEQQIDQDNNTTTFSLPAGIDPNLDPVSKAFYKDYVQKYATTSLDGENIQNRETFEEYKAERIKEAQDNTPGQSTDANDFGHGFEALTTPDYGSGGGDIHAGSGESTNGTERDIEEFYEDTPDSLKPLYESDFATFDPDRFDVDKVLAGIKQFQSSDSATQAVGLLNIGAGIQKPIYDEKSGDFSSKDGSNYASGAANVASGALQIRDGEKGYDKLKGGVQVIDGIGEFNGTQNLATDFKIGGNVSVGQALSVVNFAMALDSGDAGDIVVSGLNVYSQVFNGGQALQIPGTNVPVVAIVNIAMSLAEGDVKGAAISALALIPGWGMALSIVLSFVLADPPPMASISFGRDADGNLSYGLDTNESVDDELQAQLEEQSAAYFEQIKSLEKSLSGKLPGGKFDTDKFTNIDIEYGKKTITTFSGGALAENNARWALVDTIEPGRAVHEMVIFSQRNDSWITSQQTFTLEDGSTYVADVYDPFGSTTVPNVSEAITLGIWHGGGNVDGDVELVETVAGDFKTASGYIPRTANQEFKDVKQTWRQNGDIFSGDQGNLLALSLATGALTWTELVEAGLLADPKDDPLKVELDEEQQKRFLELLANPDLVVADGVDADQIGTGIRPGITLDRTVDEDFANQLDLLLRRAEDRIYPEEGFFVNNSLSNPANSNAAQAFMDEAQLRSDLLRELTALNENTAISEINDLVITSNGNQVTISSGDEVLLTFEREARTLGESDTFTLIEDRHFYTTADELIANDQEGATFTGVGGASNGEVSIDASGNIRFVPDVNFTGLASFTYGVFFQGDTENITVNIFVSNVDDAPEAVDDALTFDENATVSLNALLLNDKEPDGTGLSVNGVSSVSNGSVTVDGSGNYIYTPEPGFVGDVEIVYTVSDGGSKTSAAKSVLSFSAKENDAPFVVTDVFADGIEDNAYVFTASNLLNNDSDAEGGVLSLVSIEAVDPSQGTLIWNQAADTVTFTPKANFNGTVELRYVVTDDGDVGMGADDQNLKESTGTAQIVFAAVADPFTTTNHTLSVNESSSVILTNAAILEGIENDDGLGFNGLVSEGKEVEVTTVRMASGETGGEVRILANGDVQFTPMASHGGSVAFEIRLSRTGPDGLERITSRVDVAVITGNDAPVANQDDFNDAIEDTAYSFNQTDLLGNDTDTESDPFSFVDIKLTDETQGSVAYNSATGEITVTPNKDVFGDVALTYRIQETISGQMSTGNVQVSFAGTDDTASISDKSLTATEDTTRIFAKSVLLDAALGEAVDVDGETLNLTMIELADDTQGTLVINGSGDVVFTPATDFFGDVAFTFEASDGVTPVSADGVITVTADNDAPILRDDAILDGVEDQEYVLNASDLLSNDEDVDNTLAVQSIRLLNPAQGSVTFDSATGEIRFTPTANINGDVLFEYTAGEQVGANINNTDTAGLRLVLAVENDTATISNKSFNVDENDTTVVFTKASLLDTLVDVDGEALSISAVQLNDPFDGTISVLPSGDVLFTPTPFLVGVDSFSGFDFTISDGVADITASAEIVRGTPAVPVGPVVNEAPQITTPHSFANGTEEIDYAFNTAVLIASATDPEGNPFSLTDIQLQDAAQGRLTFDGNTGDVVITPTENVFGNVVIEYTLEDDLGAKATYTSNIVLNNVDDVPDIENQDFRNSAFNVDEDTSNHIFSKSVLLDGKLQDVDNETLTITAVRATSAVGITSVVLGADESVALTTATDYASDIDAGTGNIQFEIDVTDGNTPQTLTMEVRVWPVNDAPDVIADARTMDEGTVGVFSGTDLLLNDSDVEGDAFSIIGIWAVSNGKADYDQATTNISFEPDKDTIGAQWVDYLVRDEHGAFSVARLDVTVTNIDDPVIAKDDALAVAEDSDHVFAASEFWGNDINLDIEALTITAIDDSAFMHGTLTLQGDGSVRYVAEADYFGIQTFGYTVTDADGNTSDAQVELTVQNINDKPRITVLNQTIDEDIPQVYSFASLLTQATDVDGDWMSVAGVRSSYGDVTFNEDLQQIEYTPTAHFNSTLFAENAVVEYLVVDENGAQEWGEINITVNPINDEPVAYDDVLAAWSRGPLVYENPFHQNDLLTNDEEFDGEVLRILSATDGDQAGDVALNTTTGVMGYTSADGFTGIDTFTYVVGDGVAGSDDVGEVKVNVIANTGPVANDFLTTADEDTVLTFDYATDIAPHVSDVDLGNLLGLPEQHKIVTVGNAKNGTAVLNADGTVTFTPDDNFNTPQFLASKGVAEFDYTVQDIVGNESTATAEVFYNPVDDRPEAVTDTIVATIDEDNPAGLNFDPQNFIINDFDVDDGSLPAGQFSLTSVLGADNGTITDNGDGTFNYRPNENYNGVDNIRYEITDGTGLTDQGIAQVTVNPVNDNPYASDVSGSGNDRDTNTLNGVLNSAGDIDGDNIRISNIIGWGGNVTGASVSGDSIRWTGNTGSGTIRYRISDNGSPTGTVDATAYVNIIHKNYIPYISHIRLNSTNEGTIYGRAYGIDQDNDGNLRVFVSGGATGTDLSGGFVLYTQGSGQTSGSIRFTASDGQASTDASFSWSGGAGHIGAEGGPYTFNIGGQSISGNVTNHEHPIVIDLNNNGLELNPYNVLNPALYDIDGDGEQEAVSWGANGDALLAVDINEDGVIEDREEIVFTGYVEGAQTDLEGLRYFDTNNDGLLSAEDEQWDLFGTLTNNGDGEFQEEEFVRLSDSGIESINLTSDGVERDLSDSGRLHGITDVTLTDGSIIQAGDASLTYSNDVPSNSNPIESNNVIDFPSDDDVNHAVALANQIANTRPHDEDLSPQATLPTDVLVETVEEEEPVLAIV